MKRIFILAVIAVLIPFFLCIVIKKNDKNFEYFSNKLVRVKTASGILDVPLEDYVLGVITGEMPSNFSLEALKAQAVAARTFVLKKQESTSNNSYDVTDNTSDQMYYTQDYLKNRWGTEYYEKIKKYQEAVNETNGEYLTYDDKIITSFFFSTSPGFTENSEDVFVQALPYLRSVDSSWDSEVAPSYETIYSFTKDEIITKLSLVSNSSLDFTVEDTSQTGRIKKMKINEKEFTGREIATLLKLKSSYFSISQKDNKVIIDCKGFGHGVGMSQYGALGMAQEGYGYKDILKYYYSGTEIKKMEN